MVDPEVRVAPPPADIAHRVLRGHGGTDPGRIGVPDDSIRELR